MTTAIGQYAAQQQRITDTMNMVDKFEADSEKLAQRRKPADYLISYTEEKWPELDATYQTLLRDHHKVSHDLVQLVAEKKKREEDKATLTSLLDLRGSSSERRMGLTRCQDEYNELVQKLPGSGGAGSWILDPVTRNSLRELLGIAVDVAGNNPNSIISELLKRVHTETDEKLAALNKADTLNSKLDGVQASLDKELKRAEDLDQKLNLLRSNKAAMDQTLVDKLESTTNALQDANDQIAALRRKTDDKSGRIATLKVQVQELKDASKTSPTVQDLERMEAQVTELSSALENARAEAEEAKARCAGLESKDKRLEELEAEIAKEREEKKIAQANLEQQRKAKRVMDAQIKKINEEKDATVAKHKKEGDDIAKRLAIATHKGNEKDEQIVQMKKAKEKMISDTRTAYGSMSDELDRERAARDVDQTQVARLERELANMDTRRKAAEEEADRNLQRELNTQRALSDERRQLQLEQQKNKEERDSALDSATEKENKLRETYQRNIQQLQSRLDEIGQQLATSEENQRALRQTGDELAEAMHGQTREMNRLNEELKKAHDGRDQFNHSWLKFLRRWALDSKRQKPFASEHVLFLMECLGENRNDYILAEGSGKPPPAPGARLNIIDKYAAKYYNLANNAPMTASETVDMILEWNVEDPSRAENEIEDLMMLQTLVFDHPSAIETQAPLLFFYLKRSILGDILKARGVRLMVGLSLLGHLYYVAPVAPPLNETLRTQLTRIVKQNSLLKACVGRLIQAADTRLEGTSFIQELSPELYDAEVSAPRMATNVIVDILDRYKNRHEPWINEWRILCETNQATLQRLIIFRQKEVIWGFPDEIIFIHDQKKMTVALVCGDLEVGLTWVETHHLFYVQWPGDPTTSTILVKDEDELDQYMQNYHEKEMDDALEAFAAK